MSDDDPFSIKVDFDPTVGRYRWSTYRWGGVSRRSEDSFATRREAALNAVQTIENRISGRSGMEGDDGNLDSSLQRERYPFYED
jgi:hypothetical protein